MLIVMSGAYVCSELKSEFGELPPAMLPLGNKRLYQHQFRAFQDIDEPRYLVLPSCYKLLQSDSMLLQRIGVEVLYVEKGKSIGEAVFDVVDQTHNNGQEPLRLLWGDTLLGSIPKGSDIVSIGNVYTDYDWGKVNLHEHRITHESRVDKNGNSAAITGYFNFSSVAELIFALGKAKLNFIEMLNEYDIRIGLNFVPSDNWFDFGHSKTYFKSKAKFTTERAFNDLLIDQEVVTKSSRDCFKILAEARWFQKLPNNLKLYTPHFLGQSEEINKVSYSLEYLYLIALNELFVFAKLPLRGWEDIFDSCFEFVNKCRLETNKRLCAKEMSNGLFVEKTLLRIEEFTKGCDIGLDEVWSYKETNISLREVMSLAIEHLPDDNGSACVMHGDFCFSNVLYDFRASRVKVIDPRGFVESGVESLYGPHSYDVAKLSHSVLGLYDWIIAGFYELNISDRKIDFSISTHEEMHKIQEVFVMKARRELGYTETELYSVQVLLFMSMLPLHYDNRERQMGLFANIFRLVALLEDKICS